MFGMQWLFPIDIAIIIWGALVTSVAISITSCMNLGICTAYKEFNEEIKLLIQKGEIKVYTILIQIIARRDTPL
jgi:hypothetical protein